LSFKWKKKEFHQNLSKCPPTLNEWAGDSHIKINKIHFSFKTFIFLSYDLFLFRRTGKIVKKKDAKRRFDGFYDPKDYFESFTTRRSPDTSILSSLHEKKPINERGSSQFL